MRSIRHPSRLVVPALALVACTAPPDERTPEPPRASHGAPAQHLATLAEVDLVVVATPRHSFRAKELTLVEGQLEERDIINAELVVDRVISGHLGATTIWTKSRGTSGRARFDVGQPLLLNLVPRDRADTFDAPSSYAVYDGRVAALDMSIDDVAAHLEVTP